MLEKGASMGGIDTQSETRSVKTYQHSEMKSNR